MSCTKMLLVLLVGLAGALFASNEARAQIVLTHGDIDTFVGQRFEANLFENSEVQSSDELQAIVDATGEDEIYDFSEITFTDTLTGAFTYHVMPADVPGVDDPFFGEADYVLEFSFGAADSDSTFWTFFELRDEGVYTLGAIMPMNADLDGDGVPDTLDYRSDPPSLSQPLPLTYGDTWTRTSFGMESEVEVIGYGTLVGPDGSTMEALRVRSVTDIAGFESISTEFLTKEGVSASMSSFMGQVSDVSYVQVTGTSGTATEPSDGEVASRMELHPNYPNPFNLETTISYEVPKTTSVRLTVSDVLGRRVAVLVDGRQPAGRHQVAFDAGDLPTGLYFYRVETGGYAETRTMMLAK